MENFWQNIKKRGIALAPMEDVTDTVFRQLMLELATEDNLDIVYSEFVSTDGLCHPIGHDKVVHRLHISDEERALLDARGTKIVAQVWGKTPEKFADAIREHINPLGFDGIDINMGCPVPKITKQGGCSALIGTPTLAKELVLAAKEASDVPVSVKTRTGLKEHQTEEWIEHILSVEPAALILHGRTQKQMSDGKACWDQIAKAARLRDQLKPNIPVWGNGDVQSMQQATHLCEEHQIDGIMIGRGVFHDPWIFDPSRAESGENAPSKAEKLALLWRHSKLFAERWGAEKNFLVLRRFYKIYAQGFQGASTLRGRLMSLKTLAEVESILKEFDIPLD
jgi:nifR3 family TIM-barrel protein